MSDPKTATAEELRVALAAGGIVLVDVRTRVEYSSAHIEGARNLPLGEIDRWMPKLPPGEVWVICRSGKRSAVAAQRIEATGRDAFNVRGGMKAWEGPVVRQRSWGALLAPAALSLTLGLAPFSPEPHLLGKLRWVAGGAVGMGAMDWFDLLFHGAPWIWLGVALVRYGTTPASRA